jgi:hypothetical protein
MIHNPVDEATRRGASQGECVLLRFIADAVHVDRPARARSAQTRLLSNPMSNVAGATTSREEEIAFLALEQVLGVDIKLADAGAGDKKPDGSWVPR